MISDIIERAQDCIHYGVVNEHLVRDLINELRIARAQRDEFKEQLDWALGRD